jgi:hypothetical protein
MFTADTNWQIGDLGVASSRMLGRFVFDDGTDKRNFNIFFTGTNGFWTELLRLRKVNGTWLEAVRVTRDKVEGSKLSSEKAFEQVEAGYPRVSGKVDWGN